MSGEMSHLSDENVPNNINGTVQGKMIVFTISELSGLIEAEIERQTPAIIERFVKEVEKEIVEPSGDDLFDGHQLLTTGSVLEVMRTVQVRQVAKEMTEEV